MIAFLVLPPKCGLLIGLFAFCQGFVLEGFDAHKGNWSVLLQCTLVSNLKRMSVFTLKVMLFYFCLFSLVFLLLLFSIFLLFQCVFF